MQDTRWGSLTLPPHSAEIQSVYSTTKADWAAVAGGKGSSYLFEGYLPKVNVITRLEFELDYYDVVVYYTNHNATYFDFCF